jgi:dTDP-4-dehydrorhamnose reductase
MKILLTGRNGQVGFELQRTLSVLGEVVAVDRADCDLADADSIRSLVRRVQAQVIVNPAAYTAVDKAESDLDLTRAINAIAPGIFGEEARELGALVVHYSTDYVFDGSLDRPYVETDATAPQSVYGLTKCEGETALMAATPQHLILRTSWVVGAHGGNFAKTMLQLASERDSLRVVADQCGAPTSAALLADLTAHLVRQWQRSSGEFPYGLYHCTAGGETNWFDYARFVVAAAVQAGQPIKATPDKITAIATTDYPTPAKRPANSRLDCTRFTQTFGLELPPWQTGLNHILDQIL